jgi:hypothetical protein
MTAHNNKLPDRTKQHRALAVAYGRKELFNTHNITTEKITTEQQMTVQRKPQQAHEYQGGNER